MKVGSHINYYLRASRRRLNQRKSRPIPLLALPELKRNALLVEHLLTEDDAWDDYQKRWNPRLVNLAKYYGIDLAKMEKEILAETEEAKEAPTKTKGKKQGLTVAGLARLAKLMKARWDAQRKAKKK